MVKKLVCVCIALTFVAVARSFAQPQPVGGHLEGEPIIQETGTGSDIVFTSGHVFTKEHGVIDFWTGLFAAPTGTTISDVHFKGTLVPDVITNYSAMSWIILLSNGDIYSIRVTNPEEFDIGKPLEFDTAHFVGNIGYLPSVTWEKLKGDDLYALSSSGMYVSRDTGKTWATDTAEIPSSAHVWDFDLDTEQNIYAATSGGLFQQVPKGSTWSSVSSFTGSNLFRIFIDRRDRFILGTNGFGGIWISTDHGSTWANDTSMNGMNGAADDAFGNDYIFGQDANKNVFLLKSNDGLKTWQHLESGLTALAGNHLNITSMTGDTSLLIGTNFGVFESSDHGTTWIEQNHGIQAASFNGFAKTAPGSFVASDALGLFSMKPGDTSWSKTFPTVGFSSEPGLLQDGLHNLYAIDHSVSSGLALFISSNGGATWQPDTAGLPDIQHRANVFAVDELGNEHLAASYYWNSETL